MIFLATGNAVEIFGNYIEDAGRKIDALGIFDFYSVRYMSRDRHNSQFIGTFDDITVLGHRSQFSFAYGDFDDNFIDIQKGIGIVKSRYWKKKVSCRQQLLRDLLCSGLS